MQQNKITGIIGPIGSGKTTRAAQIYRESSRAAVFNAARDRDYMTHSTVLLDDDIKGFRRELDADEFRINFDTEALEPGPRGTIVYSNLAPFLTECYYCGGLKLFLDEAHQLCSPWGAPFELLRCVRLGRHQDLDIVFVSQRFASVHRELTYNAHILEMFRITEPGDLHGIADRCGKEVAGAVSSLSRLGGDKPAECLIWDASDGSFEVVQYPLRRNT